MSRFARCDNDCGAEVYADNVCDVPEPWPAILTGDAATDMTFCTWRCLAEWATARVLIESAGGES